VHWLKVYQVPEAARTSKGRAINNLLPLEEGEIVTNVLRVPEFDKESSVFFATRKGTIKKTKLEAYSRPKKGGIRAILLEEGDAVVGVGLSKPGDTLVLCSADGQAIRFDEAAARSMGRTSFGVRGIRLMGDDHVVGLVVATANNGTIITACEQGYGKRTPLEEYPIKGRGGQGVINIKTTERNGRVVGVALAKEGDDVLFITQTGMLVRTPSKEISEIGRNTQGVTLINLKDGDKLVAIEVVSEDDLERYAHEAANRPAPAIVMDSGSDDDANEPEDEAEEPEPDLPEDDLPGPENEEE
jgi:DNA gyrase subunit A